jgi:hypothetical protein
MGPQCQLLVAGYWLVVKKYFLLVPGCMLLVGDKEKKVISNQ